MRYLPPIMAALALSACAPSGPADASGPVRPILEGPVSYEVSSWGRLLLHWQVNPDGSGEIWRGEGLGKGKGAVRKYRLQLDEPALKAFAVEADALREKSKEGIPCKHEITDLPYGAITWDFPKAKQSYAFNAGCRSPEANAAMDQLRTASEVVEKRAAIEPEPYATEAPPAS